MAAQGGTAFLEKVSRMLSRRDGKPVLKPNKPLVLKDSVANRRTRKGEATCVTEMSVLMACWKANNFTDALCANEISSFYTCVREAQAARKIESEQSSTQGGRLNSKQINILLKGFPNLRKEI